MSIIAPAELVKKVFEIISASADQAIQPVLSIRSGANHFAYAITDRVSTNLQQLGYFTGDGFNHKEIAELVDPLTRTGTPFYQVKICYDHPGNVLVPASGYHQEEADLLKWPVMNGGSVTITELIAEWQLYNVYTVPGELHAFLTTAFTSAAFLNQVSVGLRKINAALPEGCLEVNIRQSDFFVLAARSGKLLVAQVYEYSVPEDVLYYLLRICREFSLSQEEVQLVLSGLVEKQSALYKELYQYFINLHFRDAEWLIKGTDYPAHFFTALNDLSQCV